jgi:L-aspartate semialdehyde sulfurtransferase ferredoxin
MESKNVLLIFKKEIMYKPLIYKLATEYGVVFNVLEAKILPKQEGRLILELQGPAEKIERSIDYLRDEQVVVEVLAGKFRRDENLCVNCGACTTVCRVDALSIDRSTMEVVFNPEKCFACGLCKMACPMKAMAGISIDFEINP